MSNNQVSYCFCKEYDFESAKNAIEKIFSSFPDLEEKLRSDSCVNVLIKPNLLAARHPDKAVTTHPVVLKALIRHIQKFNCKITIADSPAGAYSDKSLKELYQECQIDSVAEETGCNLNFDTSSKMVNFPDGKVLKKCPIISPATKADLIINVAKLKTHTLTRLTCAGKNLFGLMPGILKYRQHLAMPDIKIFSQMLLDINQYFEGKVFNLVDGIIGMEGEGPSGGDPKFAGALLGGWNSACVDILACHIMGMPVNTVPTLVNYRGLEDIKLVNFDKIRTYNFNLPPVRFRSIPDNIPLWIQNILTELFISKPLINKKICKKCNICLDSCPAKIITMKKDGAHIQNYKNCIKCYCCQEACPHKSIYLSEPFVEKTYKIFRKLNKKR